MNCPHCNVALEVDARFCPSCGKATVATETQPETSGPLKAHNQMVGREVAGRFRILSLLGEGGMGAVYRGEQMSLKRAVAVKVLRQELSANQQLLSRFSSEAMAIAKLDHPNTVKVYDFGQDTDGSLFIAMEYIEGKSLRSVIGSAGALPPARAFNIALQVAASLIDAHAQSIVHRDLKPDNVMLQDKARHKDVVRVLDFGIAKLRDDSRQTQAAMTQAGDMLGTPQYMAPEQIKGEAIDGRTDIYALGCMIYEMVTARLPYEAPTIMAMLSKHLMENPIPPSQRRPDLRLAPAIDHVVLAAMAKDPSQRPATMEQYSELLAGVLQSLPPDPSYLPSAAMSAMAAPQSAIRAAANTPPPPSYSPVPTPQSMPQPTPVPPSYVPTPHGQAFEQAPYTPGYAGQPYAPPAIPPTVHSSLAPRKSKLPLFLVLGALALGGAGVGVWAATRNRDTPKQDDFKAHTDTPGDDHDTADDPPHKDDPHRDVDPPPPPPPPSNGTDPWSTPGGTTPPPPQHHQSPPPQKAAGHAYSCDQVATRTLQIVTQELQDKVKNMTPEQLQQVAADYQKTVASAYQKIVDECTSKDWDDASRKCVMDAPSLAAIEKCK